MTFGANRIEKIIASLREIEIPSYSGAASGSATYRDEPIIRTAREAEDALPEKYREMRRIASRENVYDEAKLFCLQGKFMEDYEDAYDGDASFMRYYPTYRSMNDRQLRVYFTWRANVRRGNIVETSLSFVYVYIYELINLIGCLSPHDAINKLAEFSAEYSKIDPSIVHYTKRWTRDLKIYYGIADEDERGSDALFVLSEPKDHTKEEIFDAVCALSSFDPRNSKLYKRFPNEVGALIPSVFSAFSEYCASHRRLTLAERLFGRRDSRYCIMFPSAIFFDTRRGEAREFSPSPGLTYSFDGENWRVSGIPEVAKKSSKLGALVRATDCLLRPYFGMEETKNASPTEVLSKIVKTEVLAYFEELRLAEARRIEFDFTKLDNIRALADVTRERLTPDEEAAQTLYAAPKEGAPRENDAAKDETESDSLLDGEEREILKLILAEGDAARYAKSRGIMLSVAVEAINEKLYEALFDTAIEFDGDKPVPVADYIEDLKGYANI
ncbi:MAG: TerB N-terminal domain-containing protein [Clostridia bacterium]|nr:TerB N-terminal domain-containing protein [Clostridia bacterium]